MFARRKEAEANNVFRRRRAGAVEVPAPRVPNCGRQSEKPIREPAKRNGKGQRGQHGVAVQEGRAEPVAEGPGPHRRAAVPSCRPSKGPARVIWHQEAIPPQAPVQDFPYRNASLALLIGLGLPFGLAVGWERYVRRIGDADCLQREASLAVLGETARLPTRALGSVNRGCRPRELHAVRGERGQPRTG